MKKSVILFIIILAAICNNSFADVSSGETSGWKTNYKEVQKNIIIGTHDVYIPGGGTVPIGQWITVNDYKSIHCCEHSIDNNACLFSSSIQACP